MDSRLCHQLGPGAAVQPRRGATTPSALLLSLELGDSPFSLTPRKGQATQNPFLVDSSCPRPPDAAVPPSQKCARGPGVPVPLSLFGLWSLSCVCAACTHTHPHTRARANTRRPRLPRHSSSSEGHSSGRDAPLVVSLLVESHTACNDPGHFLGLMASRINGPQRHPGPLGTRKPHTSVAIT